jgi:hypothetical protein
MFNSEELEKFLKDIDSFRAYLSRVIFIFCTFNRDLVAFVYASAGIGILKLKISVDTRTAPSNGRLVIIRPFDLLLCPGLLW